MSSITVYNHPLPRNPQNKAAVAEADVIIFSIGMLTSFGFSFLVASYALFIVHEKASKVCYIIKVCDIKFNNEIKLMFCRLNIYS